MVTRLAMLCWLCSLGEVTLWVKAEGNLWRAKDAEVPSNSASKQIGKGKKKDCERRGCDWGSEADGRRANMR